MKKLFFIAAIAGAALVSCTKNELAPSVTEQQEISFANPVSHVVTKVDLIPATYPTGSSFSVFADYHKAVYASTAIADFTPYMRGSEGVDVSHKTTEIGSYDSYWAATTAYYWPKDGYLTFSAYSPAETKNDATITYSVTNGVSIDDYIIKQDLSNQRDLMLSNREIDETSDKMVLNNPNPYDGVQLTFNHVLSAIKFTVNTDADYSPDGYTITLKSLKVKNAYAQGDMTQFVNKDATAVNLASVWSNLATEVTEGYGVFAGTQALSTTEHPFSGDAHADLVLLPQTLNHGAGANKVIAEVIYTVSHSDMGGESIEYTVPLDLSSKTTAWDAGKRYIYNITIGMNQIVFAPKVTPWDTQDPISF